MPPAGARLVKALRAVAALVALLLVGAQLTSIGHHVLVAHYLCAEHGTLHHGDAPEARSVERAAGQAAAPADDGNHGIHDDCVFPARTPAELAFLGDDQLSAVAPSPELWLAAPVCTGQHTSIPLLALAPKLSPPRA